MRVGRPRKLTPAKIRTIRRWYRRRIEDSTAAMGRRYRVSPSTLYMIGKRLIYKDVR